MEENIIYGRNPVKVALRTGQEIEKVYLSRDITGEIEIFVRKACNNNNIPLSKVPKEKLDSLVTRKNHQGIVAVISAIQLHSLESLYVDGMPEDGVVLVLDGISDVRNIGAIARSAGAYGVDSVVVSTKGGAALNEDAVKSSAGALLKIKVCREKNVQVAIEKLQELGCTVLATDLSSETLLHDIQIEGPIAVVMGAENRGVSREALKLADKKFKLAQENTVDSLNVSVATGICLYELYKRRLK